MDAPTFISTMALFVVGVIFVVVALFETVLKSKPKFKANSTSGSTQKQPPP